MKSLNDVTPRRTASGIPSRMWGSWFRMKWKPKSSTERDSASSRSLTSAFGSVSPSSPTTNGTSVVSPVRAAAMGADVEVAVDEPGEHVLPRGVDHARCRRQQRLGPDRNDRVALDGDGRLEDVRAGDDPAAADEDVQGGNGHR